MGHPTDLGFDQSGNLYFPDISTNRVRKITALFDPTTGGRTVRPDWRIDTVGDLGFPAVGMAVAGRREIYLSGLFDNRVWGTGRHLGSADRRGRHG